MTKLSDVYFFTYITCYPNSFFASMTAEKIKRYGEYCKLEGQLEELRFFESALGIESESDIKIEETLKYMLKEDNL